MSLKRPFEPTTIEKDAPSSKIRLTSIQNISRGLAPIQSRTDTSLGTDDTVSNGNYNALARANIVPHNSSMEVALSPDQFSDHGLLLMSSIESFDPTQFAKPTSIPIIREKMRKSWVSSTATHTSKSPSLRLVQKAANSFYHYHRLESNQVRLLVVKPAPSAPNDPLNATLMTLDDTHLESENCKYAALSYNWGDSSADQAMIIQDDPKSEPISCLQDLVNGAMAQNGLRAKKLFIRPNLYEALKQLRRASNDKPLFIWVDALCIDQNDEVEKQEQVMKMAQIYRNATNVCIWLGSDDSDNNVSVTAMKFIPEAVQHPRLLNEERYIPKWASLFELLRWSWFSRRWVIQELALAREATVHCGEHTVHWRDFQDVISIFCDGFNGLKDGLKEHFKQARPCRRNKYLDSALEIDQFGAKILVETTSELFRVEPGNVYESTMGLETLVCKMSNFDASDPRDTINAFLNICSELNLSRTNLRHQVPMPDYSKDLFEVYRDFIEWAVESAKSLDIICRYWALPERQTLMPTTPRLVELPTWILLVDDSAFGRGEEVFDGRKAADSLVGLPGCSQYHASGKGSQEKDPIVEFPTDMLLDADDAYDGEMSSQEAPKSTRLILHNTTLIVSGLAIGTVSFRNQPFADGVIPKECLEKLGWSFDWRATEVKEVPDQLWRTLVADRGPNGGLKLQTYRRGCEHCLVYLTRNGHINIREVLRESENTGYTRNFLERVRAVTWDRSFIEGIQIVPEEGKSTGIPGKTLVGLGPSKTKEGDVIAILYGCSVPVILRPVQDPFKDVQDYEFIGEAYIHGKMDGEAIDAGFEEQKFRLI